MRNAPRIEIKLSSKQTSSSLATKNANIRFISSILSIELKIHVFFLSNTIIFPRKNLYFRRNTHQQNRKYLTENNEENDQ